MNCRFVRRDLFLWSECVAMTLSMPAGQIICRRQARKEIAEVRIGFWIDHQHRVVDVPRFLSPRIEDNLFPSVVRMQRGNDSFDWIIEDYRADTDTDIELEAMRIG